MSIINKHADVKPTGVWIEAFLVEKRDDIIDACFRSIHFPVATDEKLAIFSHGFF